MAKAKRIRNCPLTGVPMKDVDDACFPANGEKQIDVEWLREKFPDCNLFGLKQIAGTIYPNAPWPAAVRQLRGCLGLESGAAPTSYYHLHQLCLLGVDGPGPTLYMTHSNSEAAASNSYDAAVIAQRTQDQSGLRHG